MKSFIFLAITFISLFSYAGLEEEMIALKDVPRDYFDTGAICEEVARLNMIQVYPAPQYKVLTGVAYDNGQGTSGELDVVVFDMNTNKAIKVAEVKCWNKLGQALDKAYKQRKRFFGYRDNSENIGYKKAHSNETFTKDQFAYVTEFITIGQAGAKAAGFDEELQYSLKELMTLRDMMMKCQRQKQCVAPIN